MTILKKVSVPLYYLREPRVGSGVVELKQVEQTLYIQGDGGKADIIEAKISPDKKKRERKRAKGKYSVKIYTEMRDITEREKKTIQTEFSDALSSKKAHKYFKSLIENAMKNMEDNNRALKRFLDTVEDKKQLYHFRYKNTTKQAFVYSFTPEPNLPDIYVNIEMMEAFIYTVASKEVGHIAPIKTVEIRYT